jgi:hypothetical protein
MHLPKYGLTESLGISWNVLPFPHHAFPATDLETVIRQVFSFMLIGYIEGAPLSSRPGHPRRSAKNPSLRSTCRDPDSAQSSGARNLQGFGGSWHGDGPACRNRSHRYHPISRFDLVAEYWHNSYEMHVFFRCWFSCAVYSRFLCL